MPANPYSATDVRANRYSGSGKLTVEFKRRITTEDGKAPVHTVDTPSILEQGQSDWYTLLPCDNNITLGSPEIASLMKPVFYQDNAHTLFVEPYVTEQTIEEWQEWVTRTPQSESGWGTPDRRLKEIVVIQAIPWKGLIPDDLWRPTIDRGSLIYPNPDNDWLVNTGTVLVFDGVLIGPAGWSGLEILPARGIAEGGMPVNVNPGSGLASDNTVVLTGTTALEKTGLTEVAGGLNVVGGAGFNSVLEKNLNELNRSGFGAGMPGAGRIRR